MSSKFEDFVKDNEKRAGDQEKRELEAARARFRIGTKVLRQRLAAGLTQQQLAAASGVAQADISRIERGQGNPTAATLEALGQPLGVSLDLVDTELAAAAEA
jgi:ribosome-binding protein aMBF1 (putative translation factor)